MSTFEDLLRHALSRRISPREAIRRLNEWASTDFDANPAYVRYRDRCPGEVVLTPAPVRGTLRAFLNGEISPDDLHKWALFITLSGAFTTPDPPPDDEDWFDPMWDVIHDLACPEVHGPITPDAVAEKFAALARYADDPAEGAV